MQQFLQQQVNCFSLVLLPLGLPYVIDFEPHISFPAVSGQDALRNILKRWPYPFKPCFVADAAIGSFDLLQEIHSAGM